MANGFSPAAADDPAAAAFLDEESGQSVDPLLEPDGQSVEPVPDDPAQGIPFSELADIGELARTMTSDPIPLVVAEIHEEIQKLLRLQRDICDGIELATDQVQDKRIEFLEAGPEVTLADIFIEVALVFFLESPLLGAAIRRAYRFAGARILTGRAAKLTSLKEAAQGVRGKIADNSRAISRNMQERIKTLEELPTATGGRRHKLLQDKDRLGAERAALEKERQALARTFDAPDEFQEKSEITERKLKAFFSEAKEAVAGDYGVAVTKAVVAGKQKLPGDPAESAPAVAAGTGGGETVAADTIGVQVKSLAQFHLRNMELYLGLAAADADMLRSIALGDPFLAPDCFILLSKMKAALRGAQSRAGQRPEGLDARHGAKIEFEKLIWALLIPMRRR